MKREKADFKKPMAQWGVAEWMAMVVAASPFGALRWPSDPLKPNLREPAPDVEVDDAGGAG